MSCKPHRVKRNVLFLPSVPTAATETRLHGLWVVRELPEPAQCVHHL